MKKIKFVQVKKIISNSFPSKYEYNIRDNGMLTLKTRTINFNEGQVWPIMNSNIGYLSIAKNMSTSFVKFLQDQQLLSDHFLFGNEREKDHGQLNNIVKKIVFLRNPYNRYLSGLTEYIILKLGADIPIITDHTLTYIINMLLEIPDLDEHTLDQAHFFRDLNLNKFTVFMLDSTFSQQQLIDWMKDNGVTFQNTTELDIPKENITQDNETKRRVYDIVKLICDGRRLLIKNKCMSDYQLISHFKKNQQIINDSMIDYV